MTNTASSIPVYIPTAVVLDITKCAEVLQKKFADLASGVESHPEFGTILTGRPKQHQYSGARSFSQFPALLEKKGLRISGAYINISGKLVFTIGKELDPKAERLFLAVADHTGWSVVEFRNADHTKVWAANCGHVLTDEVKIKGPKGSPDKFEKRNWRAIQVWETRV